MPVTTANSDLRYGGLRLGLGGKATWLKATTTALSAGL